MRVDIPDDRPRIELSLPDGTDIWVSPLTAEDQAVVEEGFEELSEKSRFTRFGHGLGHLTQGELRYLTDVDQRHHVAWGASTLESIGMGVGRYIRLEDGSCAEVALTVVDDWQGIGVGRLLFRVLTAVARADGVDSLCFRFMPENRQVQRMLEGIDVELSSADGLMEARMAVSNIPPAEWDSRVVEVLGRVRD